MDTQSVNAKGATEKRSVTTPTQDISAHEQSPPGFREWCVVSATFLVNLLFAGIIFGWAPMQLLLEDDGVYASRCADGNPRCNSRATRLVFLYTVGSTTTILCSAPCGVMVDRCGPVMCGVFGGVALAVGLVLVGISDEHTFDAFVVGSMFVGIGGCFGIMNSLPAVFIVAQKHMSFVVTVYNCLFDASSVIFLVLYQLYARVGLSRQTIFVGYGGLCLTVHAILVISWASGPVNRLASVKVAEGRRRNESREQGCAPGSQPGTDNAPAEQTCPSAEQSEHPPLHGLPLRQQIASCEFAFIGAFFTTQLFRSNMYLGSNKELLQNLGDASTNYTYSQMFALSLPASAAFAPLISWCLQRRGFADTFLLITFLGIAWNAVALLPFLEAQPLAFGSYTFFRAFLYSAHFTYIAHTFGSRASGTVHGILAIAAAAMNFLIWPCVALADGELVRIYAPLLGMCLLPLGLSLWLRQRLRLHPVSDCRVAARPCPEVAQVARPASVEADI